MLTRHETWDNLDSSKLSTFLRCPRKFFYRYVLGWRPETESIHLVFGKAWHSAMEVLFEKGLGDDAVTEAFEAFQRDYRASISPEREVTEPIKTSAKAADALVGYAKQYRNHDRFKTLYTEIAGTVPISNSRVLQFRMDAIVEDPQYGIVDYDHKTTSRLSQQWQDQFMLSVQFGTYMHVLCAHFGIENVFGVVVNGAVLRKKDFEFIRVPIRKQVPMLEVWLYEVNRYVDRIEEEFARLEAEREDDSVMRSFPRNPESCGDYTGCPFHTFCQAWPNPLQRCQEPQPGFVQEFWDPMAEPTKYTYTPDGKMEETHGNA